MAAHNHHQSKALNKENNPNNAKHNFNHHGNGATGVHQSVKQPFGRSSGSANVGDSYSGLNKSAHHPMTSQPNKSVLEGRRATSNGNGKVGGLSSNS